MFMNLMAIVAERASIQRGGVHEHDASTVLNHGHGLLSNRRRG